MTELSQTGFLEEWKLHTNSMSSICSQVSAETAILNNLEANLCVEGDIRITSANGEPLLTDPLSGTSSEAINAPTDKMGSTALRQQLFSDASAGTNVIIGHTKKDLVSSNSAGRVMEAVDGYSVNRIDAAAQLPDPNSSIAGMKYKPPNFLSSSEGKVMDNDAWTQSLQNSMGVNSKDGMPFSTPSAGGGQSSGRPQTLYMPQGQLDVPDTNLLPPSPVNVKSSYQPAHVMAQVASHYTQYSLCALAERKMRQLSVAPNEQVVFRGSAILSRIDAKNLYYSIPFIANLPTTNLVYSTRMHERSIKILKKSVINVMGPTMVVIRSGEYVFGGYSTDQWKFDGSRGGNPKGYLFSITLDCKIPYHGRQKDSQSGVLGGMGGRRHDCIWSGNDFMSFGIKDLCLRGDFTMCSSEIEHSYSIGCEINSRDSKSFLAGSSVFVADEIEVWGVEF